MLHLINYPFSGSEEARRCLARLGDHDILLFIENGVYSVMKTSASAVEIESWIHHDGIFALTPDLAARGISIDCLLTDIKTVDYSGFVRLAANHNPVQSWFK